MNDPRLNIGLQTKLSQKLVITPQMKQSLSLLQMPIADLVQEISEYLEANPALEVSELENDDNDYPESEAEGSNDADSDEPTETLVESLNTPEWDEYINEGTSNELSFTPLSEDDGFGYEQFLAAAPSLSDHLLIQLKTAELSNAQYEAGVLIIGNLSDEGYFYADLEEIAEEAGVPLSAAAEALAIIKTFDPTGIASQSLAECILAQLPAVGASIGEIEQIKELLTLYSKELEAYRYDEISKKTGLDKENIIELIDLLRKTDPRPGLNFGGNENNYILPDVYIVKNGDEYDVLLNETGIPSMRLSNYYLRSLKDVSVDDNTKQYIEEKVKNAVWILKSLQKRQKAIYKVSRAIVNVQAEYLAKGEAYLKPLRLRDIAEMTELHESTVSRVTAGKYALSERGLLELKSFFSKGMDTDDGDMSTRQVKLIIRQLIDEEPADKPYSDEAMVALLAEQGIDVARRTVAKYRDELGIATMSKRKRMRR